MVGTIFQYLTRKILFFKNHVASDELKDIEFIRKSGLFDAGWYLENNADVAQSGMDPVLHYVRFGAAEGRNPSSDFDTKKYLVKYPYVVRSKTNPLLHFIKNNQSDGGGMKDCSIANKRLTHLILSIRAAYLTRNFIKKNIKNF